MTAHCHSSQRDLCVHSFLSSRIKTQRKVACHKYWNKSMNFVEFWVITALTMLEHREICNSSPQFRPECVVFTKKRYAGYHSRMICLLTFIHSEDGSALAVLWAVYVDIMNMTHPVFFSVSDVLEVKQQPVLDFKPHSWNET